MYQMVGIPSSPNEPLLDRSARNCNPRLAFLQSGAGIKHDIPSAIFFAKSVHFSMARGFDLGLEAFTAMVYLQMGLFTYM
jgi:hypothetical protein